MLKRLQLDKARKQTDPFRFAPTDRSIFGSFHSALLARLGFGTTPPFPPSALLSAINHPNLQLGNNHLQDSTQFWCWRRLGETSVAFHAAEHIHFRWPDICSQERDALLQAYTSREAISRIGANYGLAAYYEFPDGDKSSSSGQEAHMVYESTLGLLGLLSWSMGGNGGGDKWSAWLKRNLLESDFLTGRLGVFLGGKNPSLRLGLLMKRFGMPPVEYRLVGETGRGTEEGAFVVNAYCSKEFIAQGVGRTLAQAKRNACELAFGKLTLEQRKGVVLPSEGASEWDKSFTDSL